MELKTAIEILDYHQEWRQGRRDDMIHEPKKLTQALDIVLCEVKKLLIHDVSKRLYLDDISIELYSNDSDEDYRIDINTSNINGEAILNKEQALQLYKYLGASLNVC